MRKRCSSAVSRAMRSRNSAARAAEEPAPERSAARCSTASSSLTVTEGDTAGTGSTVRWVSSIPVRRWRSDPER